VHLTQHLHLTEAAYLGHVNLRVNVRLHPRVPSWPAAIVVKLGLPEAHLGRELSLLASLFYEALLAASHANHGKQYRGKLEDARYPHDYVAIRGPSRMAWAQNASLRQ